MAVHRRGDFHRAQSGADARIKLPKRVAPVRELLLRSSDFRGGVGTNYKAQTALCRAEIHVQGSVRDIHEGDEVIVGPTPLSKLLIKGTVDGKDDTNNIVILRIDEMTAPSEEPEH